MGSRLNFMVSSTNIKLMKLVIGVKKWSMGSLTRASPGNTTKGKGKGRMLVPDIHFEVACSGASHTVDRTVH